MSGDLPSGFGRAAAEWRHERDAAERLRPIRTAGPILENGIKRDPRHWRAPQPIPDGLLPVAPFDMAFLPESIAPWVADIAERMQCAPDFVAVPAMVALGAVLGASSRFARSGEPIGRRFPISGAASSAAPA